MLLSQNLVSLACALLSNLVCALILICCAISDAEMLTEKIFLGVYLANVSNFAVTTSAIASNILIILIKSICNYYF